MLTKGGICFGIRESGCNKAPADRVCSPLVSMTLSPKSDKPQARLKRKSSGCGSRIHQQARAPVGRQRLQQLLYKNRWSHCRLEGQRHGGANIKAIPW
jgi:hypothetical protein